MTRTAWSLLLSLLIGLAIIGWQWWSTDRGPYVAERTQAEVVRVADGDTVTVRDITGHEIKVRILGIDTPETVHPSKPDECYGPEASAYAKKTLTGTVVLAYSSTGDTTDRYGRTLAYVELLDGTDYGRRAVELGYARLYDGEKHDRQDRYQRAQKDAMKQEAGLWGQPTTEECN